jgi:hypothetical protein
LRILLGCVAFLALAAPAPQSSFNLRARYGKPDVQRFAIRPGITMAVEYGSDGKACIFDIEPRHAFIHELFFRETTISKATALDLLDEVAPPERRGVETHPLFSGGAIQASCGAYETGEYQNARVGAAVDVCKKPIAVVRLDVRFTRPACEPLAK